MREITNFMDTNTLIAACNLNGMIESACHVTAENATRGVFEHYIMNITLGPSLSAHPGANSALILDNCTLHHNRVVEGHCDSRSIVLIYLPRYSPDKNPIELRFAKLRSILQRPFRDAQNGRLIEAIDRAFPLISSQDMVGYFGECGYAPPAAAQAAQVQAGAEAEKTAAAQAEAEAIAVAVAVSCFLLFDDDSYHSSLAISHQQYSICYIHLAHSYNHDYAHDA
jgi:hypothetical protein